MTSSPSEYLNELVNLEREQGQAKLHTLAGKYHASLARLPRFRQEIEAQLALTTPVDFQAIASALEPALAQATEFLMTLDMAELDYPDQPDLPAYGNSVASLMTAQTTAALVAKFQQKIKAGQQEKARQEAETARQLAATQKAQADAAAAAQKAQAQADAETARIAALSRLGYVEHGDGTVTDTKTGLMWKQCAEGQSGPDCQGRALVYPWETAIKIPVNLNLRGGFAGHHDWRLPTKDELASLVFPGAQPAICLEAFPNLPDRAFWSSTELVGYPDDAWVVNFYVGSVGGYGRGNTFHVRLVR